jgi:hypothetical protein
VVESIELHYFISYLCIEIIATTVPLKCTASLLRKYTTGFPVPLFVVSRGGLLCVFWASICCDEFVLLEGKV